MAMQINNEGAADQMVQALRADDDAAVKAAWTATMNEIAERIEGEYAELKESNDARVLAERGYRSLTAKETKWYNGFIERAHGAKQQFIDYLADTGDPEDWMPETIIEDVFKDLAEAHPLLSKVKFTYVGFATKWVLDDSATQKGAWGRIDATITAEIEGALKVIDLTQNKYTAFVTIPLGIIDMGPTWLDAYIRAVLGEAISYGVEDAIINGTGVDMPVGLTRNPNSTFNAETGYEEKTAVAVTSFSPAEYGELVAALAQTEAGKQRTFTNVQLIVNMTDYLTKIMPATTLLGADGAGYVRDLFPYPTEVITSKAVPEGEAILCLLDQYTLAAGGRANGAIEYDDSIGFLDHTRTFRSVSYYAGRAYDNTCATVLDITNLDPAYITVKTAETVA